MYHLQTLPPIKNVYACSCGERRTDWDVQNIGSCHTCGATIDLATAIPVAYWVQSYAIGRGRLIGPVLLASPSTIEVPTVDLADAMAVEPPYALCGCFSCQYHTARTTKRAEERL